MSKPVKIRSGVCQGCSLPPHLFICCIAPLANSIRADRRSSGLFIPGGSGEVKCVLYMDDISIVCRDEWPVMKTLEYTEEFCRASGSKVNLSNSEGMMFGRWKSTQHGLVF